MRKINPNWLRDPWKRRVDHSNLASACLTVYHHFPQSGATVLHGPEIATVPNRQRVRLYWPEASRAMPNSEISELLLHAGQLHMGLNTDKQ